ncbi:polysaccharide biosynthesis tyrosine autokinase [Leifsonia kafniensis]|uniref:Polysaccharide biosynthesis tyrosine autokinase n=1 Tax=Leifsonia kafniensis TaxID=475957 RepID=A0ABP7KVZ8_9MICO
MDQRGFWNLVRSRWIVIVTFALLGVIAASAYVLTTKPEFTAQTELFVATVGSDNTSELAQGSNYSQQQARNYSVVATRQIVLDPVITALGLDTTSAELSQRVTASVPLNTSLISIAVTDTSPSRAAATANAVATSLVNTVVRLVPKRTDGTSPVRLEAIQNATVPSIPSAPNSRIAILLGLLGGLVLGIACVVIPELVSARIRSVDQIKQIADLSMLGSIDYDRGSAKSPLVTESRPHSLQAEEFRQIRTKLRFLQAGEPHKVFVVTSSIPGEGKSVVSANLAASLAASGTSVCVVEADLRHPALGDYFDLDETVGLTEVLARESALDDAIQAWGPNGLRVLLSGDIPPNPSELLASPRTRQILDELRQRFEVVIIDCPPLLPVTDAAILVGEFGGAILVVGSGRVKVRELRKSIEILNSAGTTVLGTILNLAPRPWMTGFSKQPTKKPRLLRRGRTRRGF